MASVTSTWVTPGSRARASSTPAGPGPPPPGRPRRAEAAVPVGALHLVELNVDEPLDGIGPEGAADQDRHRAGDAGDGARGAQRPSLEVAHDHALRRRQQVRIPQPL